MTSNVGAQPFFSSHKGDANRLLPLSVRLPIVDPDLRSPSGFDSGLCPPLRMTREGFWVALTWLKKHQILPCPCLHVSPVPIGYLLLLVRSPIVDPDLRSPCGFDSGLCPPLRMTRGGIRDLQKRLRHNAIVFFLLFFICWAI